MTTMPPSAAPPDYRFGYRRITYNLTSSDREFNERRLEQSWLHNRPFSVFVAAMGSHWKPGCWQHVIDMVHYTNENGYYCAFEEIMDRCFNPYDALGAMRNEALMRAAQGYEWLLYVDNDIMPKPDMLIRLLSWDQPIIAPYVVEPGTGKVLHGPIHAKYSGLQQARWCVLSMLLFRTTVFNATGPEFWNNAVGADEGYHFQKLWHYGHRPYIDTNLILPVASVPTYPLATNRMEEQDAKSFWDKRRAWLLEAPDRRPINPNDPHQQNGEYLPFVQPEANKAVTDGTMNMPLPQDLMGGTKPILLKHA